LVWESAISVVDWTVFLTAAVTGATGLLSGIWAARLQARNTERQLETQIALLRSEQEEKKREARKVVYHEFLNAERAFQSLALSSQLIDPDVYSAWQSRFDQAYNGVQLFGAETARRSVQAFAEVFPARLMVADAHSVDGYSQSVRRSYWELFPEIQERRNEVIAALRHDVGPPPPKAEPEPKVVHEVI
jgi:hypothetical protein